MHVIFAAKIQSMKNAVPKNDKKRRKQLTEDIAKLEAELDQKHEEELRGLSSSTVTAKVGVCVLDSHVRDFKLFLSSCQFVVCCCPSPLCFAGGRSR